MLGADPEFIVAEAGQPVLAPQGLPFDYDPPLVELRIPPAQSGDEFVRNVEGAVSELRQHVGIWPHEAALLPFYKPHFGNARYAYRGGLPAPEAPLSRRRAGTSMWHYAGGHLHLSYESDIPAHHMALLCDLYIGAPLAKYDTQPIRRQVFGWPGLYRETSYGIEYRTLSNKWALNSVLTDIVAECAFELLGDLENARSKISTTDWCAVHKQILGAS